MKVDNGRQSDHGFGYAKQAPSEHLTRTDCVGKNSHLFSCPHPRVLPRLITRGLLRDRLEQALLKELDYTQVNGNVEHRLPGLSNISFNYVEGEGLMMAIPDIAVSSGSACTSASLEPSYVLKALGLSDELAHSSIRFGIGRFTTEKEVDYVVQSMVKGVRKLRELSPLYEMVLDGVDLSTVTWQHH